MSSKERPGFTRRLPELDGVRGLAILMVLIWHFWVGRHLNPLLKFEEGTIPSYLVSLGQFTWSGVDLFYVPGV